MRRNVSEKVGRRDQLVPFLLPSLLLISDAWAELRVSERALPVVTALISPRSVKSCANIEWSITQTNDRRTTGRTLSLSVSLKHWRDSKAQFDAVKRTHSLTRSASRPSFPPDPLPLAFDPRVRASTKFGGDRPQQKGKERREREGENHHFNFSICSGATPETTDRWRWG